MTTAQALRTLSSGLHEGPWPLVISASRGSPSTQHYGKPPPWLRCPHATRIPHALLAINQAFLLFSFRFVNPSVRISVAVAFPFIGCPLTRTLGAAAESTPCFANASSLCSSLYSFSSLSLRSSSATLKKTKRYAIRKIAQSQNKFRACRLARSAVEM